MFRRDDLLSAVNRTPEAEMIEAALGGRKIDSYLKCGVDAQSFAESICVDGGGKSLEVWLAELRNDMGDPVLTEFRIRSDGKILKDRSRIYAYPDFGLYLIAPRVFI